MTRSGLDTLVAESFSRLRGLKLGVVANAAAVDSQLRHLIDLLVAAEGVEVKTLFAPEHGFRGALQDMESVAGAVDKQTGLPVISLYGASHDSLAPTASMLRGLDAIVVDLPDIGSRYYTFAQTMAYTMQVAGTVGVKVFVIDRPNPINGVAIEGAPLQAGCRSFCGLTPVANRHALTLGELAHLYRAGFGEGTDALAPMPCELEVVPVSGWHRAMYFDETHLPWVLPSPNMPTLETATVYPGGCLFEATNLSEGRGTTRPFELVGAPFLDGAKWAEEALAAYAQLDSRSGSHESAGAALRPVVFVPKFHKWAGEECGGVQLHITDRSAFHPFRWGLSLIAAAKKVAPSEFQWRTDAYEFVDTVPAIDLLFGSALFRQVVDGGGDLSEVGMVLAQFETRYRASIQPFLLY